MEKNIKFLSSVIVEMHSVKQHLQCFLADKEVNEPRVPSG